MILLIGGTSCEGFVLAGGILTTYGGYHYCDVTKAITWFCLFINGMNQSRFIYYYDHDFHVNNTKNHL
ncbi:hypothetical protein MtrunA17_Chr5g0436711 [Medicago truncatula]|uniref:Uncharacterized protein n=1 Tax=Medicago truncatula TaxID=3880 RepID=A0A396HUS3_MEDTR|nr:hypothetical protein MtrunA17_Chr5g0436711 [Medicago truncatula]